MPDRFSSDSYSVLNSEFKIVSVLKKKANSSYFDLSSGSALEAAFHCVLSLTMYFPHLAPAQVGKIPHKWNRQVTYAFYR